MFNYITPVMYTDSTGYFAVTTLLIFAGVGALIGGGIGIHLGYQKTGSFEIEYALAGMLTGALIGAGGYALAANTISISSSVLAIKFGFTKIGIGIYLGAQTLGSMSAQYQNNVENGDPKGKGILGAGVGGFLGSGLDWITPGFGAAANAMFNEFENELFYDNDSEIFSWNNVGNEFLWYAGSNYTSRLSMLNPVQGIVGNYVFDYIAIRNSR